MTISRRLRFEILRRDNHACRYCGAAAPDVALTVDHVIPAALGGGDDPSNLVTACADCNSGKASVPPDAQLVADVQADAIRWARAIQHAAETQRADHEEELRKVDHFQHCWEDWTFGTDKKTFAMPAGWERSVLQWMRAGIEPEDFQYVIDAYMHSRVSLYKALPYMGGVVRNLLADRAALARQTLGVEET